MGGLEWGKKSTVMQQLKQSLNSLDLQNEKNNEQSDENIYGSKAITSKNRKWLYYYDYDTLMYFLLTPFAYIQLILYYILYPARQLLFLLLYFHKKQFP